MATRFNARLGLSVGPTPTNVIDANGSITANSLVVSNTLSTGNTTVAGWANVTGTITSNGDLTTNSKLVVNTNLNTPYTGLKFQNANTTNGVGADIEFNHSTSNAVIQARIRGRRSPSSAEGELLVYTRVNSVDDTQRLLISNTTFAVNAFTLSTTGNAAVTDTLSANIVTSNIATFNTSANVGANVQLSTSQLFIGNSTVNTVMTSSTLTINAVNSNTATANNIILNRGLSANGSYGSNGQVLVTNSTAAFWTNTVGSITVSGTANVTGNVTANNVRATGSVQIDGDLYVNGNTVTIGVTDLKLTDNLIYLNEPEEDVITNATSNGTAFIYTANNGLLIGMVVTVTGITPSGYNVTANTITFANATHFAVANTTSPGAYVSGGTASGRSAVNPDLGFAGGYDDGTYRHAGFFRDATDGVWKVFDNYEPEPNGAFIDTSNNTFRIAAFQANALTAAVASLGNTTITGFANVSTSLQVGTNTATIGTGTYFVSNGNVGINTSTPTTKLAVQGNDNKDTGPIIALLGSAVNQVESGRVRFMEASGSYQGAYIHYDGNGNRLNIGTHEQTDVLTSSDINAISITRANANVGIGNTVPTHKLSVNGDAFFQSSVNVSTTFAAGNTTVTGFANVNGTLAAGNTVITGTANISGNTIISGRLDIANSSTTNFRVTTTASATNFVQVYGGATGFAAGISFIGGDTNVAGAYLTQGTGWHRFYTDATGSTVEQFRIVATAGANSLFQITGSTSDAPLLEAAGVGTNVSATYKTKGTGAHVFRDGYNAQILNLAAGSTTSVNLVRIYNSATGVAPIIEPAGSDTDISLRFRSKGTGGFLFDTGTTNNKQLEISHVASAVNYIQVSGGTTTNAVLLQANGSDTNVTLRLLAKNNGYVDIGAAGNPYVLQIVGTASGSNYNSLRVTGGVGTVSGPTISSWGIDTNVDINYTTKGTGSHIFNTGTTPAAQVKIVDLAAADAPWIVRGGKAGTSGGSITTLSPNIQSQDSGSISFRTNAGTTGAAGTTQFNIAHTLSAVNYVQATGGATGTGPSLTVQGGDTNADLFIASKGNAWVYLRTGGTTTQAAVTHTASAVNYLQFTGSATGSGVSIGVGGTDTNVDLRLSGRGTGAIVMTSNTATFAANNVATVYTTLTTSATTANQVLDSWSASVYRSAKYVISITSGSSYEQAEVSVIHNGTSTFYSVYGMVRTGSVALATYDTDISSGNVRLLVTPTNATTTLKVVRTAIAV